MMPMTGQNGDSSAEKMLQALTELMGLSEKEAQLYFQVLKSGPVAVKELKGKVDSPRTRLYAMLRKLESEGLVQLEEGSPTKFSALSPSQAIEEQIRREKAENDAMVSARRALGDDLEAFWAGWHAPEPGGWIQLLPFRRISEALLVGLENVHHRLDVAVKSAGGLTDWSSSSEQIYRLMVKGIPVRFLTDSIEICDIINQHVPNLELRFLEDLPTSLAIVDDVCYQFFLRKFDPDNSYFLVSAEPNVLNSVSMIYQLLWEKASDFYP